MLRTLLASSIAAIALGSSAHAEGFSGGISGDARFQSVDNTDDNISGDRGVALSFSAYGRYDINNFSVFGDLNSTLQDMNTSVEEYAGAAQSAGLHFGYNGESGIYLGAFVGLNRFKADSAKGGYGSDFGRIYGVEGQFEVTDAMTVYGQVGRAKMVGDPGDTAFIGRFSKLGVNYRLGDMTLLGSYETGYSPDIFEDSGDWGRYRVFSMGAERALGNGLIGTVSLNRSTWVANTEDSGGGNSISVGVRMPLGGATTRNNLTTSYNPGLAAAWAEALD